MIERHGFHKGQHVEFQDFRRCWVRGTVQFVEWAEHRIIGPNGTMHETKPRQVHVLIADSLNRKLRVLVLNPKRVRAVEEVA